MTTLKAIGLALPLLFLSIGMMGFNDFGMVNTF